MNSLKIKCKESFSSFGKFPNDYPNELYGNIEKTEFEMLINNLNQSCKKSFNKLNLLWLIGPLTGIALIVVGIVKWRKSVEQENDSFDNFFNNFNNGKNSNFNDFSGFSKNDLIFNAAESYKPDKPLFFFVIGIGLFLLGLIIFSITYCIFKRKVLDKIEQELIPLNSRYSHKRISFSLENVEEDELISDWEFNTHRNNQAYMNGVKYDKEGRPIKKVEVHYLVITYPLSPVQTHQVYSLPPNYSDISVSQHQQQLNIIPMETFNNQS